LTASVNRAGVEDRLRDIQSITDAALSRLDDHDLLTELLERTKDILQAESAAVLLDFSSGELIATAAAGLEEEVHSTVLNPTVIAALAGSEPAHDDIALLMFRRPLSRVA
jgi:phosphoserine phosphatase RsbU/P